MQPHRNQEAFRVLSCSKTRPSQPPPDAGLGPPVPSGLSTLKGIADLLNSALAQCHRNGERIAANAGRTALWETDRILHMLVGRFYQC